MSSPVKRVRINPGGHGYLEPCPDASAVAGSVINPRWCGAVRDGYICDGWKGHSEMHGGHYIAHMPPSRKHEASMQYSQWPEEEED